VKKPPKRRLRLRARAANAVSALGSSTVRYIIAATPEAEPTYGCEKPTTTSTSNHLVVYVR